MKRLFRWVLRLCIAVLILPTLLIVLVCVAVYQPKVQQWVADLGLRQLSQRIGYVVSAERVRIQFPLRLQADGLTLVAGGDTLIAVQGIEADVSVGQLAEGAVAVTDFAVRGVTLRTDTLLPSIEAEGRVSALNVSDVLFVPSEQRLRLREVSIEAPQIALRERVEPMREMAFSDVHFLADSLLLMGGDVSGAFSRVALAAQLMPLPETPMRCQILLSGPLERLTIQRCHVVMAESIDADVSGRVTGLPRVERLGAQLEWSVSASDPTPLACMLDSSLHRWLPIVLPIHLDGTLSYLPDTMYTNLTAQIPQGMLSAEVGYRLSRKWCTLITEASYADTLLHLRLAGHASYSPESLTARLYTRLTDVHLRDLGIADTDLRPSVQSRLMVHADSTKVYTL